MSASHCLHKGSAKMSYTRKFLQGGEHTEKRKVNAILSKESRNMSIECKTLFVSVWDAVIIADCSG